MTKGDAEKTPEQKGTFEINPISASWSAAAVISSSSALSGYTLKMMSSANLLPITAATLSSIVCTRSSRSSVRPAKGKDNS